MSRLIHFVTALLILGKYVPTIISPFDFDRKSELQSGILTCMLGEKSGLGNISVIRVPLKGLGIRLMDTLSEMKGNR